MNKMIHKKTSQHPQPYQDDILNGRTEDLRTDSLIRNLEGRKLLCMNYRFTSIIVFLFGPDLVLVHWPHFTWFLYGSEFISPLPVIALYKNHAAMLRYIIIFANWNQQPRCNTSQSWSFANLKRTHSSYCHSQHKAIAQFAQCRDRK